MPTAPKPKQMRDVSPELEQYMQTTLVLIEAAATYASSGERDPETDALIRKVRTLTSALLTAMSNAPVRP